MEIILSLEDVTASYDGKAAVSNLTMDIEKNRITAIIGPSGCGKSTLLRSLNRMIEEEPGATVTGKILLGGRDIQNIPKDELRRRVGLVFQVPTPFPFSIYRNMAYAPKYHGLRDGQKLHEFIEEKLKMAGLYDEVKDDLGKNAVKLSGGQQQRLCIARALTVEPDVLLLDEPSSSLDVKSAAIIENLLLELKKTYTIVLVTHNIAQARRVADKVAFLYDGELIEYNEKKAFFDSPKEELTRDFLGVTCDRGAGFSSPSVQTTPPDYIKTPNQNI